jgi:hypothetical protein
MHPFVASGFAAARVSLRRARQAQEDALTCALMFFEAGANGDRARRLRATFEGRRAMWLAMALTQRARAKALRRECQFGGRTA